MMSSPRDRGWLRRRAVLALQRSTGRKCTSKPPDRIDALRVAQIEASILSLPPVTQEVFILHRFNDLPYDRIAIRLDGNQNLTFNVDGQTATFSLGGAGQELSGHLTLRNSLSVMQVHDMYMDLKRSANASTTGEMVPVNLHMTATVDQGEYKNRPRSRVVQSSLETSNASLTEYVPMLSLAQKVFSAISKIISTHNAVVDDINSLLR